MYEQVRRIINFFSNINQQPKAFVEKEDGKTIIYCYTEDET